MSLLFGPLSISLVPLTVTLPLNNVIFPPVEEVGFKRLEELIVIVGGGTDWTQSFSDTITFTDDTVKSFGLNVSDSVTLTDEATKFIGFHADDILTLTDSTVKNTLLVKSDSITLSDGVTITTGGSFAINANTGTSLGAMSAGGDIGCL